MRCGQDAAGRNPAELSDGAAEPAPFATMHARPIVRTGTGSLSLADIFVNPTGQHSKSGASREIAFDRGQPDS